MYEEDSRIFNRLLQTHRMEAEQVEVAVLRHCQSAAMEEEVWAAAHRVARPQREPQEADRLSRCAWPRITGSAMSIPHRQMGRLANLIFPKWSMVDTRSTRSSMEQP